MSAKQFDFFVVWGIITIKKVLDFLKEMSILVIETITLWGYMVFGDMDKEKLMTKEQENRESHKNILSRLTRIEGQIGGIRKMVENGRDCEEIIIQLSAVSSALTNTAKLFLQDHIEHCVVNGIARGETEETLKSLQRVVDQFAKMK